MVRSSAYLACSILLLNMATQAQQISPYLTGTNVWYNPSDAVWAVHATAGHKIMRIGGHAYDDAMPSKEQLTIWVNKIKAMGAEPLIQVSQYQSAEAAAALVRYFNVETKNTVRFWGIGNEPWLQAGKPDMGTMPGRIAGYVKPAASAMKAVDPTIRIYVVNECYYDAGLYKELFNSGSANDLGGKDANGRYYVDGASWHRYNSGTAITGADDIIGSMKAAQQNILEANIRHGRTGADKLGWGIGEFNSDAGEGLPCSFGTGQMVGAVYGGAMRYEATFATMWSMLEGGGSCGGTDFSIIGNDLKPRPSFNHMQLIAKNMSGTYAHGTTSMGANIFPFGSKSTKDIAVMILNRGGQAYTFALRLDNQAIAGNGVNIDAGVAVQHEVAIGANTTMLLVFALDGSLSKRYTYNATMATPKLETINEPPVVVVSQPIPGKLEAESYSGQLGIQTEATGDVAGGGLNVGWFDAGDWMDYAVDVAAAAQYQVRYRIASPAASEGFVLKDGKGAVIGGAKVPQTPGQQAYVDVLDTVVLSAGKQTLRLEAASGGWNLNWMDVQAMGASTGTGAFARESDGVLSARVSPTGRGATISFRLADDRAATLRVVNAQARVVARRTFQGAGEHQVAIGGSGYPIGTYFVILKDARGTHEKTVFLAD